MVPFSETLVRLWQLVMSGNFITQFLDSAKLFLAGFVLALIGESLGRIQRDVEQRPLYRIEEEL